MSKILIDEATVKLALEALRSMANTLAEHQEPTTFYEDEAMRALKALAEQPAQQEPVAWPIETNNQVEALAKQCGWDNRRYMTPADYQIWCDRMRQFVQLASPQAQPAPVQQDMAAQILREFPLFDDVGLDEEKHHCEWTLLQDRKRLHAMVLNAAPQAQPAPVQQEPVAQHRDLHSHMMVVAHRAADAVSSNGQKPTSQKEFVRAICTAIQADKNLLAKLAPQAPKENT